MINVSWDITLIDRDKSVLRIFNGRFNSRGRGGGADYGIYKGWLAIMRTPGLGDMQTVYVTAEIKYVVLGRNHYQKFQT